MTQTRAVRLPAGLKIGLAAVGALIAWFFLLDLAKAELVPQLESSWIAALTFAATEKLQFGRDIIYTYGPLAHLAISTFSPRLFTVDLIGECCLKAVYVALIGLLGLRLGPVIRGCFLAAAFALAVISFQTMHLFALTCLGWLLIKPSRPNDVLLFPALLFAAVAALIKLTFFWFALFVLACATVCCVVERRILRAAAGLALFAGAFCAAWFLAGQEWGTLPAFFWAAREVTSGYSKTMGLSCPGPILTAGLAVSGLVLTQLGFLLSRNARQFSAWAISFVLGGGLFLAWKLGFTRADTHTLEFFYFASLMALALPAFFERDLNRMTATRNWVLALVILAVSIAAITFQDRNIGSKLSSILLSRSEANLNTLLRPSAAEENAREIEQAQAKLFALPRVRDTVGRARVDVFGYEQAIALLNGLNYAPSPNVQTYCDYTPALAELAARFYRSDRTPDYVLFQLQRLDNRLVTLNHAEVLVRLAQDYEPLFAEGGYLLLKRRKTSSGPLAAELIPLANGTSWIGSNIPVPAGVIWCELQLKETLLGKLFAFLYHPPEVRIEVRTAGDTANLRFLPTLGRNGFLINPLLNSAEDFIAWTATQQEPASTTQTIRIVPGPLMTWFYRPKITYRMSQIPMAAPSAAAAALLHYLHSFTDVFSTPASFVKSDYPSQRFSIEAKSFLLVHPTGEVRFEIPAGAIAASGEFAFHPQAYLAGATDGVEFQVEYVPSGASASPTTLFRRTLEPVAALGDRGIQRFRVELPVGAEGQLVLRTLPGAKGNVNWDWVGWSNIQFEKAP